jgi:hypothetical protein
MVVLGTLAAGYGVSFRLRRRIWRARQVSGTRPPDGYWWEDDRAAVARYVAVTLVGAALVVVATSRLPEHDRVLWAAGELVFVPALLGVLVRVRRTRRAR